MQHLKIWKKLLTFNEGQTDYYGNENGRFEDTVHEVPADAKIIHCGAQFDPSRYGWNFQIAVWYEVPVNGLGFPVKHHYRVFGTGETFTTLEGEKHLKTVVINKGERVWHVYHSLLSE